LVDGFLTLIADAQATLPSGSFASQSFTYCSLLLTLSLFLFFSASEWCEGKRVASSLYTKKNFRQIWEKWVTGTTSPTFSSL